MRHYKILKNTYGKLYYDPSDNDSTGCYSITDYHNNMICYYKDTELHNEKGAAIINGDVKKYWLNGKRYGDQDDYTDEFWIRFCKLKVFH